MLRWCLSQLVNHVATEWTRPIVGGYFPRPVLGAGLEDCLRLFEHADGFGDFVAMIDNADDLDVDELVKRLRRMPRSRKLVVVCVVGHCRVCADCTVDSSTSDAERARIAAYSASILYSATRRTLASDTVIGSVLATSPLWGQLLFMSASGAESALRTLMVDRVRQHDCCAARQASCDHRAALRVVARIAVFDALCTSTPGTAVFVMPHNAQSTVMFNVPRRVWEDLASTELLCLSRRANHSVLHFRSPHIARLFLDVMCPNFEDLYGAAIGLLDSHLPGTARQTGSLSSLLDLVRPPRLDLSRPAARRDVSQLFQMLEQRRQTSASYVNAFLEVNRKVHQICADMDSLWALNDCLTELDRFEEAVDALARGRSFHTTEISTVHSDQFRDMGASFDFAMAVVHKRWFEHCCGGDDGPFPSTAYALYRRSSLLFAAARRDSSRPHDVRYLFAELQLHALFLAKCARCPMTCAAGLYCHASDFYLLAETFSVRCRYPPCLKGTRANPDAEWDMVSHEQPSTLQLVNENCELVIGRLTTSVFQHVMEKPSSPQWMHDVLAETQGCLEDCRARLHQLLACGRQYDFLLGHLDSLSAQVRDGVYGPRDTFVTGWLQQNRDAASLPVGTLPRAIMTHVLQSLESFTDPLHGERLRCDWMLPLLSRWLPSFVTRSERGATFRLTLGLSLDYLLDTTVALQLIPGLSVCDGDALKSVLHSAMCFCRTANEPGQPCYAEEWTCCTNSKAFTPLLIAVQAPNRSVVHVVRKQMLDQAGATLVRLYQRAAVIRGPAHVTPQGWDDGVLVAVAYEQIGWLLQHTACGGVMCYFAFTLGVGCLRAIVLSCRCGAPCVQPPPQECPPNAMFENGFVFSREPLPASTLTASDRGPHDFCPWQSNPEQCRPTGTPLCAAHYSPLAMTCSDVVCATECDVVSEEVGVVESGAVAAGDDGGSATRTLWHRRTCFTVPVTAVERTNARSVGTRYYVCEEFNKGRCKRGDKCENVHAKVLL